MWYIARDLSADGASFKPEAVECSQSNPTDASWPTFRYLADLHGVTPLLFLIYRPEGSLPALPEPVRAHLQRAYINTRSRAQWMLPHFHCLANELNTDGIGFLILKGFPLTTQLYGDLGARPSYDIDFWLRDPGDAPRVVEILRDLGYESVPELAADRRGEHRHLVPFWKPLPRPEEGDYFHPRLPWTVEPHIALWEESWWGLRLQALEGVWERQTTVRVDGKPVPVLGAADSLVYLSMHQMLHIIAGNARLLHLQDLHRLCPRLGSTDWQQAWLLAERAGLQVFLAAALWLTRSIFGTSLPPQAEEAMDSTLARRAVRRWLEAGAPEEVLLQDPAVPHSRLHRLAWLSALFARGLRHKPRAFLQPILGTVLPPAELIRRKYDLKDRQSVVLYYVPHVLQGMAGYVRRALRRL
jgi:hypothetical protein